MPGRDDGMAGAAELESCVLLADGCNVGDGGGGSGLAAAAAALALATALATAAGRAASTCSSICDRVIVIVRKSRVATLYIC